MISTCACFNYNVNYFFLILHLSFPTQFTFMGSKIVKCSGPNQMNKKIYTCGIVSEIANSIKGFHSGQATIKEVIVILCLF